MSELFNKSGIYVIINTVAKKFYVGSAVCFNQRWMQHESKLNLNIHTNRHLQSAWNKYGPEAFEFKILEIVDKIKLLEREQFWMDYSKCCDRTVGYNLYAVAGSPLRFKQSKETIAKREAKKKGFKHSEEAKIKMRNNKRPVESRMGKRDIDVWPHDLGFKCKCKEYKEKQRNYLNKYRRDKRLLTLIFRNLNVTNSIGSEAYNY